jgi:hypothetical protein
MKALWSRLLPVAVSVIFVGVYLQAQKGIAPEKDLKLIGTWKLNIAKSTFHSGPAPKAGNIHTWWWDGDGLKHKIERLNEKGDVIAVGGQWIAKYDAADHLSGGEGESRVSLKRIDAYTSEMTEGVPGKPLLLFKQVVSKDGKTLTITRQTEGQDAIDVLVHDKQ